MKRLLKFTMLAVLAATALMARETITIKGSDTLVRLGRRWAAEYMRLHENTVIQVSGGGSEGGIAALLNGTTHICESSRRLTPDERELAERNGIEPHRVVVARDGVAVFINPALPIDALSVAQLRAIYNGTLTNWSELGGPDRTISIYGRDSNSGTHRFFLEHVLVGDSYADHTQELPSTASVANAVAKDLRGIGYGGLAWAEDVKALKIRATDSSGAIAPTPDAIAEERYPLARQLYWYFDGPPAGELKHLLDWALSPQGQRIAEEIGYIPMMDDEAVRR